MKRRRLLVLAVIASAQVAMVRDAAAQLADENVLVARPRDFVVASQHRDARGRLVEFVRDGESVADWSVLLGVQTFFDPTGATAAGFRAGAQRATDVTCPGNVSSAPLDGVDNGYPYVQWTNACPNDLHTGKPEWNLFKAIRGKDALYVVHVSFRSEPDEAARARWTADFARTHVCDTRTEEHPCPEVQPMPSTPEPSSK